MKKIALFTLLFFLLMGTATSFAQSLERGDQVTTESAVVSGKPYLLYYVGNNSCYVKANADYNYFKALASDLVLSDEAIYYFKKDGDKWKIQSRKTGKYFPKPTKSTTFVPTEAADAGLWALNFQSNNNIAPSSITEGTTYSLNRSRLSNNTSVLHGWTQGTALANQLRIYEISLSKTSIVETGQEVSVSNEGTGETTLTTDQWYVLRKNGSFFIDDAAAGYTTTVAPIGYGINNSQYLVRLESDGTGSYYVQTGYGNYLFTDNTTTRVSAVAFTEAELKEMWEFHKLVDPIQPTASEVYTLNGTGAWIFVPNGFTNQYYLYNVSTQEFASLTVNGEWTESAEAVPVLLVSQGDSHHCITTKDGTKTYAIGTETHMTIAKSRDVTSAESNQLSTALGKLLCNGVDELTLPTQITADADALAADHTKGWFALRVKSESNHPEYGGNFLYTLAEENQAHGRPHPMSHGGGYMKHPLKDDAQYYVRLWPVTRTENGVTKTYYHWQVPSGKYVVNHGNDYPITWIRDASDFIIDQNADGTFYIQSSGYRAQICTDDQGKDYLGKTSSRYVTSPTRLDFYPVDVSGAGLRPWKVVFNTGAEDVKLHYNGAAAVKGLKDVYHNGFFFFPQDVTPGVNDFQINEEVVTAEIHDATGYNDPYTIHVVYAPNVCFTSSEVTVVQGSRTTGLGNEKQALLRAEVSPIAPCHPTQFSVNVTGASNLSKIEAWLTTADQLHADGVTSVCLGSKSNPAEGTNTITVDEGNTSLLMTGEHNYIWITADIKNDASIESNEVDAALTRISYQNALPADCAPVDVTNGNPDGTMRIFFQQKYLWVSTDQNADVSHFYRNPVILPLDGSNVLAFCEYRYDDVSELGKDYDDSDYGHRIDLVMRTSPDNGETWSSPVTIANGTDATENAKASGYSMPAVVRTKSGKIICLAAMGQDAFDSNVGLRHIAMMTSENNGATWTTTDIYNSIAWEDHSPSSAYITAGKGVCFNNGRIAFVLNEREGNNTNEYVLYSDDEGATWKFVPTSIFMNGKWAKLAVMNDDKLLATISRGSDSEYIGRGKNTTTGSAAADGILTWNVSGNWDGKLNSYGRNSDILYYQRAANGLGTTDVLFHTVYQDALRLYASFDQAETWKEFFTILPAEAQVSSIQALNNGNLAIVFEDGSIGGGANGSYAMNYVVIRKQLIEEQTSDLLTSTIIKEGETDTNAPYVTWSTNVSANVWAKSFTTQDKTGFKDVVVSSSFDQAFNKESGTTQQRVLCMKPSAGTDNITITAPDGYLIKSYTIKGYNKTSGETFTLTAGTTTVNFNGGSANPATFTVSNINAPSTTFTFARTSGSGSWAHVTNFVVVLERGYYAVKLNQVNPGVKGCSYATLYTDYDLRQTDSETKAYYVSGVVEGKAILTETAEGGRNIPKRTAVVLVNSEGTTQTAFTIITTGMSPEVDESDNLLKGTLENMTLEMSTNPNLYSFGRRRPTGGGDNDWVAGFYNNGQNMTLSANRCYLDTNVPPVQSATGFDLSFDEETTSVDEPLVVKHENSSATTLTGWYTLDGRKLSGKPVTKGLYIWNGRKYYIK